MSEIKRVALNSFEPPKVCDSAKKNISKTLRITVTLPESNEDKCPEYNYKDLLALEKKRSKSSKDTNGTTEENGLDPFGENDDDVRRIALEMEAKYGNTATGKKKYKGRRDDYADIGLGYDESDSFIDNTDGYDEIIPQNVTTLHGGFYINCGALEFKTDDEASIEEDESSSSESEDEDSKDRPAGKKRVIDSSDDNSDEAEDTANNSHIEKKPKLTKNNMQLAIKKQLFSQNKIQVKKRRPMNLHKKTVKELLKEKKRIDDITDPEKNSEEGIERQNENRTPANITIEEDYDNNQNQSQIIGDNANKEASNRLSIGPLITAQLEGESSQDGNKSETRELVALPESLDSHILDIVNKIKQRAIDCKGEGKIKFFSGEVNSMLLSLERKCKNLGKASRIKVYEHLSYFIKCRRETLIRRAKSLVLADDEKRLVISTNKLKDIIDHIMPPLLSNYEKESAIIIQKKLLDNEENKTLKMPRRRFHWTEEGKRTLKEIMTIKRRICLLEGKQKDNLEDQMVSFMKAYLIPLWREGWMSINSLKKVYNSMIEPKLSSTPTSTSTPNSHSNKIHNISKGIDRDSHNNDMHIEISPLHKTIKNSKLISNNNKKVETNNDVQLMNDLLKSINTEFKKPQQNEDSSSSTQTQKDDKIREHEDLKNVVMEHKERTGCFAEMKKHSMPIKKNEKIDSNNMNDSYAELLKSINSDFKKPLKSSKLIDGLTSSHMDRDKTKDYVEQKERVNNRGDVIENKEKNEYKNKSSAHHSDNVKHNKHAYSYSSKNKQNNDKIIKITNNPTDLSATNKKTNEFIKLSNQHPELTLSRTTATSSSNSSEKKQHINDKTTTSSENVTDQMENVTNTIGQTDIIKLPPPPASSTSLCDGSGGVIIVRNKHQNNNNKDNITSPHHINKNNNNPSTKSKDLQQHCPILLDLTEKSNNKTSSSKTFSNYGCDESKKDNTTVASTTTTNQEQLFNSNSSFYSGEVKPSSTSSVDPISSHISNKINNKSVEVDDVQMVLENLKALHKLSSSPIKQHSENSSSASPVSVIAFNKNFTSLSSSKSQSSLSSSSSNLHQRAANKNNDKVAVTGGDDSNSSFLQEDFQKQFINSIQNIAAANSNNSGGGASNSSNKSNYRCS